MAVANLFHALYQRGDGMRAGITTRSVTTSLTLFVPMTDTTTCFRAGSNATKKAGLKPTTANNEAFFTPTGGEGGGVGGLPHDSSSGIILERVALVRRHDEVQSFISQNL